MQNSALKSSIIHGLEGLVIVMVTGGIDYLITYAAPILPPNWQPMFVGIVIPILSGIVKWLRASTWSTLPDYVNKGLTTPNTTNPQ